MSIEAMKQALEALETIADEVFSPYDNKLGEAIIALRTAIAEAEKQEPVALETVYETIIQWDEGGGKRSRRELARRIMALYTTPQPQREWVGLTDKEMLECNMDGDFMIDRETAKRNVEAKLKEKNHG